MNDDPHKSRSTKPSWLERLSTVLLREPQDREQLVTLLRDAEDRELLDSDALAMIEGVLQVSEMQVRDIMIPRSQMIGIIEDQSLKEFLPTVIESAHSRFPVLSDDQEEVVGVLLAKDLLKYKIHSDDSDFNIRDIIRPAMIAPESKRLDVLLKEFRVTHNHMAIVVDEYGGIAGLVTIEDILEQIVGEIEDEFDIEEEDFIKKHSESEYIVKALTPVDDFNEHFKSSLSTEEFDTIGGLVTNAFGHLPNRGETVTINNYAFKVLHADKRKISLLQVLVMETEKEVS